MLGAARCAGAADGTVVTVDLGHSTAKSGLVQMRQGELSDLRISRRADVGLDPGTPVPVEQLQNVIGPCAPGRRCGRPRARCTC